MKLLSPSPLPRPAADRFASLPSPRSCRAEGDRGSPRARRSRPQESLEGAGERVYVAVGRTTEKGEGLLGWAIRQFGCREIGIVHVHQPSATIPTLLGRIPARQADEGVLSAYRREERKDTNRILLNYVRVCEKAQVHSSIIMIENENVQKGVTDLVERHGIRKLVVGAPSDNHVKVKRSSKVAYTIKNAPPFCEIWFIHNGKHVWTREASDERSCLGSIPSATELEPTKRIRSCSPQDLNKEPLLNQENPRYTSFATDNLSRDQNDSLTALELRVDSISSTSPPCSMDMMIQTMSPSSSTSTITAYFSASPAESSLSLEMNSKEEQAVNILYDQLTEVKEEAERWRKEAIVELMKCRKLESEFADAMNRAKMFEAAYAHEIKLREELEVVIRTTKKEQEQLSCQRDKAMRGLENAMRDISVLENQVQEVERHQEKAARELKFAQASIATVKVERHKIRRGREEAAFQQEWGKHCSLPIPSNCKEFVGFAPFDLIEFSLSELQSATCNFSDSFKIGQEGFCCVYKGEIQGKTVVIKKLHAHDVQGQMEFQKEVNVLSKIKHPHLVTLIGICSEAWSLVYEYLSNGNLQDHLMRRTNAPPLVWKVRTRIVAEMCSALLFLHSSRPEQIIHGDLMPQKIHLASDLSCKIGDIAVCRLVPEVTLRCPSFRRSTEPKEAFPYTDPECQRTGKPTPKSDIYALGIIVLQLLTGRSPVDLASEVRRGILGGKLSSILDPAAGEWPQPLAERLAKFGLHCSEMNARDRPELTPEVVRELEQLLVPEERPVPPFFLCPISQEIMHDPVVAADGFTYEGEALRGWLENGRETSPMTNLKLDHLILTPNHALRIAIHDWLCRSG